MNIGFITPHFYPDITGGIEWYSFYITSELARRGNKIYIFTQLSKKANQKEETINNLKILRLSSFGFFYRLKLWKGLSSALKKYHLDIIISLDYAQTQTWQAVFYARRHHLPICILLYDIQSQKKPRHPFKQFFLDLFDNFFAGFILRRANAIFIRTPAVKNWLIKHKIDLNKVKITPSGITDLECQKGNAKNFEKKFKIKKNIILFLGRIRKQKGIFLLQEAFQKIKKEVPDAKLVYIGPDEKEYDGLYFTPLLQKKIAQMRLTDVYLLGPLYGKIKNDAIAASSVLALPSSYEAFGQVFLQAFAQGKPVIGTWAGGVPFVVTHKKDGFLIKPWDKEKLAFYLIKLLKNKKLAYQMGQAGKEKVKNYQYKKLAEDLEKIIKEII